MNEKINCFIPAAGLGERMRPITGFLPKPLLPVLGRPVLAYILEKLSRLPAHQIGINLHYKKEAIEDWIDNSPYKDNVLLFPEDPVLDTGGALKNAEAFLSGGSVFLVHNADILSDIDLTMLLERHYASGNTVTLAVHDCHRFNIVIVDGDGNLKGVTGHPESPRLPGTKEKSIGAPEDRRSLGYSRLVAYTGIAVYNREFLAFVPGGRSGVVNAWLKAAASGYRVGTMDVTGSRWDDVGTPDAYASAVFEALKADGETVYFHPEAEGCAGALLNSYSVVEKGCGIMAGVSLRNSIVLPGSVPDRGAYENCIIGPDFVLSLNECKTILTSGETGTFIGSGGSDRKYFRIERKGATSVQMQCAVGDMDFERHMEYTRFFRKFALPVPELISADTERMTASFEDLGDVSLYNWLKCPRTGGQVERIYRKALDILVTLHSTVTDHVAECPLLANRIFDYDYLRWETAYFVERFVKGIRGISHHDLPALEDEFNRLALKVDAFTKTVIHRDFQSQNIMIEQPGVPEKTKIFGGGNGVHDGIPRLIDYQGARMAPPAYDVVSLLWDPYHCLDDTMRARLLAYYERMRGAPERRSLLGQSGAGMRFDQHNFEDTILPCRLQRHMQALGAYGFLSLVKGKRFFLKHVPEALRLLKEEAALAKDEYPVLYTLVMKL